MPADHGATASPRGCVIHDNSGPSRARLAAKWSRHRLRVESTLTHARAWARYARPMRRFMRRAFCRGWSGRRAALLALSLLATLPVASPATPIVFRIFNLGETTAYV